MGWQNAVSVRALQIIVSSGAQGQGIFVYSGTPAAGNSPVFAVVAPGVTQDPFGNTVSAVMNIGNLSGAHIGWDANGKTYVSNSSGNVVTFIDSADGAILVYNSSGQGAGNLIASISPVSGSDSAGNQYLEGFASYGTGVATQLDAGLLQSYSGSLAGGWTLKTQMVFDSLGDISITSGAALSIFSNAGTLQLQNGTAFPASATQTQQGAAPAAYNQAFTQGTVNRINTLITQVQTFGGTS